MNLDIMHLLIGAFGVASGFLLAIVLLCKLSATEPAHDCDTCSRGGFERIEVGHYTLKNYDAERLVVINHRTGDGAAFKKEEMLPMLEHFYGERF